MNCTFWYPGENTLLLAKHDWKGIPLAWLHFSRAQVKERGNHMMQRQGLGPPPTCQADPAVHMPAEGRHRLTTPHRRNYYELIEGLGMVVRGGSRTMPVFLLF